MRSAASHGCGLRFRAGAGTGWNGLGWEGASPCSSSAPSRDRFARGARWLVNGARSPAACLKVIPWCLLHVTARVSERTVACSVAKAPSRGWESADAPDPCSPVAAMLRELRPVSLRGPPCQRWPCPEKSWGGDAGARGSSPCRGDALVRRSLRRWPWVLFQRDFLRRGEALFRAAHSARAVTGVSLKTNPTQIIFEVYPTPRPNI